MPLIQDVTDLVKTRVQRIKQNGKGKGIRAKLEARIENVVSKVQGIKNNKIIPKTQGIILGGDNRKSPIEIERKNILDIMT